jgi:predicted nucleic acid-binding protein
MLKILVRQRQRMLINTCMVEAKLTVLIDTGVFFAFYSLRDKHHYDSLGLIAHLVKGRWGRGFITDHILDETLNILKYRISPETSKAFIEVFIDKGIVEILYTESNIEKEALKIFVKNLGRKGFSYTDAVTVAVIKEYGIRYLLSYDIRSFQGLVDSIIGPDYWQSLPSVEKEQILKLAKKYETS